MDFNNVNVNVSGPIQPTSTYKTKILKGNHSFISQITEANMKYVIKHDFDLSGEEVTIPEGCLLEFDGGAISNGTLVGQSTILIYNQPLNDILTATLEGTWRHESGVKADEEDITDLNGELKFKDKAYAPANYSGLGRNILRKNIVNDVNTLTQSMINDANTIYVIQYDFTLGEDITVPDNCVLEFDGGSISGAYTLIGNNTKVVAPQNSKIFHTIDISGTWNVPTVYVDWFELSETTGANNTPSVQNALALTDDNVQNTLIFPKKTLYVNQDINYSGNPQKLYTFRIKSNTDIILDSDIVLNTNDVEYCTVFYMQKAVNVSVSGCGGITGDLFTHTGSGQGYGHGIYIRGSKNIRIRDIYINQCWGDGIDVDSYYPYDPRQYYDPTYPGYVDDPTKYPASNDDFTYHSLHILIDNVKLDNNRRQGISFEGVAYSEIKNCRITNTGQFLSGDDSMGGIDVEPWVKNEGNRGINIHDNSFYNNYKKDIALVCIGGDGTGWGSYITLRNNYNKEEGFVKTSMCYLDNLTVTNSNINNGEFYKIHDVVFENCKINNIGRIEYSTGTAENNYNIYFKNCKFVKSSGDNTEFIGNVGAERGLKADFINCLFETGGNCSIINSSAYSEISLYDCVVNAAGGFAIGGVKNIVNSNITCTIITLSFNQASSDYIIKGNFIKSISTSDYILIRIDGQETLPATISIYFEDNYIQKAMHDMQILGLNDAGFAPIFVSPNFYIIGNKGLNNPRFGAFTTSNMKRYGNACLGEVDTDPYIGEMDYPDNNVPKVYNGTQWVDATGTPV